MTTPSIVSTWEGVKDYPKGHGNALMILTSGAALAACIIGKTGDLTQYSGLNNMNSILSKFFLFADVGVILKSIPQLCKDWTAYLEHTTGETKKTVKQIRDDRHINFPQKRAKVWIGMRTAALLGLVFSKYVAVSKGLHGIEAIKVGPSSMLQAFGAGAGALACGLNIAETRRARSEDGLGDGADFGSFVSDHELDRKLEKKKKEQFAINIDAHRCLLVGNRLEEIDSVYTGQPTWDPRTWNKGSWDQLSDGILLLMKAATLFAALHNVAGVPKPFKAVAKWVDGNANNLFTGLFAAYVLVGWAGHAMVGASIKELEKRYVEPKGGE